VDPVRAIVRVELRRIELVVEWHNLPGPGELDQGADAGCRGDVGRVAGRDLGLQDGIEVSGGLERDLDTGLIRERLHDRVERIFLGAGPGAEDVDGATDLPPCRVA